MAAVSSEASVPAKVDTASDSAVDDLIFPEAVVISEIETLVEADVPSSDPLAISVPSDSVLVTGVNAKDTTTQTLLVDQGFHHRDQNHPTEDEDKPFFLPKNRKSGRKTTKHN